MILLRVDEDANVVVQVDLIRSRVVVRHRKDQVDLHRGRLDQPDTGNIRKLFTTVDLKIRKNQFRLKFGLKGLLSIIKGSICYNIDVDVVIGNHHP